MADPQDKSQKTEEATPRKLEEARKKGNIPVSRDVNGALVVLAATVLVAAGAGWIGTTVSETLMPLVENADGFRLGAPSDAWRLLAWVAGGIGLALAPVGLLLLAGGVTGGLVQTQGLISGEQLKPKLERINPMEGVKRIVSLKALVEFLKGMAKVTAVTVAVWIAVSPWFGRLEAMALTDAAALPALLGDGVLRLLLAVFLISAVIAVLDLMWQNFSWRRNQRMSFQELKEEFRQSEGDPHVKARLKRLRRERARRRMFQEIPTATVVVTNPTHFAVALRYDLSEAPAPLCVAKGVDLVAQRIREAAMEHKVPLVENPPLARLLFKAVELGDPVQPEHYQAVAEVIGYVMSLKAKTATA